MKVLKFGGTSVGTPESISHVIEIVGNSDHDQIMVSSAVGGVTNLLQAAIEKATLQDATFTTELQEIETKHLNIIQAHIPIEKQSKSISFLKNKLNSLEELLGAVYLIQEASEKTIDSILSFGELIAVHILEDIFIQKGIQVRLVDARDFVVTYHKGGKNHVDFEVTEKNIQSQLQGGQGLVLVPGFISRDRSGEPTTLGRGGSDYTAALIAYSLDAAILEIWTDVSGMYTAHPKLVQQAQPIPHLSYHEAMELSHFGAKVIYPPTLQPLVEKNIPLRIKNTFDAQAEGTLIDEAKNRIDGTIVKGISHIDQVSLITLEGSGMIGIPGFSKRLFEALSAEQINVIMITQASSEHSICLGINADKAEQAKEVIDEAFQFEINVNKVSPARIENNMVNIAVVGEEMKNHQGISGKLFSSLGANNINIRAIAQGASERNISIMIDAHNVTKALNTLHESFFEAQVKELNLFITGVGNVGGELLRQIAKQYDYLLEHLRLKIKIRALSNSRKMLLDEKGISLTDGVTTLNEEGIAADREQFFAFIKQLNLRNSIVVDNTANPEIAAEYSQFLKNNIGVVTCNKIAAADQYEHYSSLKKLSRQYKTPYLFETNVGAGLPIIDTLNNLIASGDRIIKIQAVLSGSLNFIFNTFKEGVSFADVVREAQKAGYTEPDPTIDLSGVDVARKILILARESGMTLELEDIENIPFIPKACFETPDTESFFTALEAHSDHFDQLLEKATQENARIKYVAELVDGKARVGIQYIPEGHDFYNLEGSDNIILFYTNRYLNQPLIVKGAGAGAEVTAAGVFGDIIRIGRQ